MLPIKPLARDLLGSFAKTTPVFFINADICVVLPPGAAAIYSVVFSKQFVVVMRNRTTYIEATLVLLGAESHDREKRGRSLQNVMASQILGSGTQWYTLPLVSLHGIRE